MCTRNIHTHRPRSLCGWVLLGCSYLPSLFACLLIFLNVFPFHAVFLPYLAQSCAAGEASWGYYYYSLLMMLFAEAMVYGNFFLAIVTPPGYVPHEPWSRTPAYDGKEYSENPFEVRQLDRFGKLRYCSRCEQFKPDNAHHCSLCNRCVYRQDHHCPWICNCVGRNNAKYFLLFLGYIPVGAFHIVATTAYSCFYHFTFIVNFSVDELVDNVYPGLVFLLSMFFSACMGLCFGFFALHFFYMAYRGETSVSVHIAKKRAAASHEGGETTVRQHPARDDPLYDFFGADRRWWRMLLCFPPTRDERGLVDETPPNYMGSIQKLV